MLPLPDPVEPTESNILRLHTNLKNMQAFNDQLYLYTITKCANAFILLGKNDNNDPGLNVGINLLCGGLIGIGGEFDIIGCVAANYLCGLTAQCTDTKPPSLLLEYTSYITRVQATSLELDVELAASANDPVANWNTVRSGSFASPWGNQTLGCTLGQLAAIDFPAELDSLYMEMMEKAVFAFDQTTWWVIMNANLQINGWNTGFMLPTTIPASRIADGDAGMDKYDNNYMIINPAHWSYWIYASSTDKKGHDTSSYVVYDYSVGIDPHNGNDRPISNEAATYLFIDTNPGTIVNPNGLFNRLFVFTQFGLKTIEQVV
jgi:hypothetical protein